MFDRQCIGNVSRTFHDVDDDAANGNGENGSQHCYLGCDCKYVDRSDVLGRVNAGLSGQDTNQHGQGKNE